MGEAEEKKVLWTFFPLSASTGMLRPVVTEAEVLRQGRQVQVLIMVSVAQLVELWIVAPAVVGSSPIAHPRFSEKCKAESEK